MSSIADWLTSMPTRPSIAEQRQCPEGLGSRCLQHYELLMEREALAQRKRVETKPKLIAIAPDITVTPEHLTPEYVIQRWTEPMEKGALETRAPCCGRPMEFEDGTDEFDATCPYCHLRFDGQLVDEGDGGYRADFVPRARKKSIVVKRHRSKKTRR